MWMLIGVNYRRTCYSWWLHQIETVSALLALCHRWIPRLKASDAYLWCFLWSAPWINGWVQNRNADDFRRHRSHHEGIVMARICLIPSPIVFCIYMQVVWWTNSAASVKDIIVFHYFPLNLSKTLELFLVVSSTNFCQHWRKMLTFELWLHETEPVECKISDCKQSESIRIYWVLM